MIINTNNTVNAHIDNLINALVSSDDLLIYEFNNEINITVNDFEGFTEDWSEIMREYDIKAVNNLLNELRKACKEYSEDFYHEYKFEDFTIVVGWHSYDI